MMARTTSITMQNLAEMGDARRRERTKCDVFHFLSAGSAAGSSAGIAFTHGPIFGFFAPQGRHVAPIKFHLDRFRGGGLRSPKLKKLNFTNIIAPGPLHDFY